LLLYVRLVTNCSPLVVGGRGIIEAAIDPSTHSIGSPEHLCWTSMLTNMLMINWPACRFRRVHVCALSFLPNSFHIQSLDPSAEINAVAQVQHESKLDHDVDEIE